MPFYKAADLKPVAFLVFLIVFLTAFYSLLSGPVSEKVGVRGFLLNADILSKESRAVVVYHTLAVPFVSIVSILILYTFEIERGKLDHTVKPLLWGSFIASVSGVIFSYFKGGMIAHGLFITGLSIVFYGGLIFFLESLRLPESLFNSKLEKASLVVLVFSVLVSVLIGALVGAFYGTKFKTVLAEDIIRKPHGIFERAVISHLHIVVALVAASILFLLCRLYGLTDFQRFFYFLFLFGVVVTSVSTWSVIIGPLEKKAHKIINVGAMLLIASSFVYAYNALKRFRGKDRNYFEALSVFHLFAVNATVTAPGVYVAFNLSKFRLPENFAIERTFATGHWHILATTCALILSAIVSNIAGFNNSKLFVALSWISHLLLTSAFVVANFYFFTLKNSLLVPLEVLMGSGFVIIVVAAVFSAYSLLKKPFSTANGV